MPSTQKQRARWAKMFGWICMPNSQGDIRWSGDGYSDQTEPPDFAALDGPWFGPAVKELLDNAYEPILTDAGTYAFIATSGAYQVVEDADLGVCTMLALEAKRAAEEQK